LRIDTQSPVRQFIKPEIILVTNQDPIPIEEVEKEINNISIIEDENKAELKHFADVKPVV
jgi:hypothetical protein